MSRQVVTGTLLIFGAPPNPRLGGISSVVHDQVLALTELGYQVLILYAARALDASALETSVSLCQAAAYQAFRWRDACSARMPFTSFDYLVSQLDLEKNRALRAIFAQVDIFHSHADSIIPRETHTRRFNSYETLLNCVERLKGVRPKLVRTRHDDLQGGLDRFMRLTGIDFMSLNDESRKAIRDGKIDLRESVTRRTTTARSELRSQGLSEEYLNEAIHHVWFVTALWQLWRREQMDADAIVSLNHRAMEEVRDLMPNERNNLHCVYNGTSFGDHDKERVDELLSSYHGEKGLHCFRAGSAVKEPIAFNADQQKILLVGRDDPSKGVAEFVRAISQLYHGGYPQVRAILAGRFEQARRIELSRHDSEHARNYLLFTGQIEEPVELAALFAFGNVTAICSHYEPFNLVACESYRMGTPCVVTEGIGAADVYLDNPARFGQQIALPVKKPCCSGLNRFYGIEVDSLAKQIACLIDNPELAYSLGQSGRRFVEQHYSYPAMGKRYSALYLRLQ